MKGVRGIKNGENEYTDLEQHFFQRFNKADTIRGRHAKSAREAALTRRVQRKKWYFAHFCGFSAWRQEGGAVYKAARDSI
jgi:hypothetical protein